MPNGYIQAGLGYNFNATTGRQENVRVAAICKATVNGGILFGNAHLAGLSLIIERIIK